MITMMKEKVNTHFSFPMRLNMSAYMEENLLPDHASQGEKIHRILSFSEFQTFWIEFFCV